MTKTTAMTITTIAPRQTNFPTTTKSAPIRTKRAFSTTTQPTPAPQPTPTPAPIQHKLDLRQVLRDLEYDSLLPAIETPPQLQSLLLDQSKFPNEQNDDGSLQVYHLILLSSQDFRTVFPNDLQRNRLKEHIRNVLGGPLLASDGTEPMSREQYNAVLNDFYSKQQHVVVNESEKPVVADATAATPAADATATDAANTAATTETTTATTTTTTPADSTTTTTTTSTTAAQPEPTTTTSTTTTTTLPDDGEADKQLAKEMLKISLEPLRMPKFFDAMKNGSIQAWHVKVGEHFVRGQLLCDIDTDIAELSFEAPEPGHLSEILVQVGESVPVGDAIAVLRYQEDTLVGTKH